MKKFLFWALCLSNLYLSAQSVVTRTLVVKGNCGECKERIENASDIKGVKLSAWNVDSKVLKITYDSLKVSLSQIKEAIVSRGHDLVDMKSADAAYKKLPKCCRYRETTCKEK